MISQLGKASVLTARVLFRKISKAVNQQDYLIIEHKHKIQQLEARVQQLEPRKRRKVRTSPNSKFVEIKDIMRAQIEAGDRQIEEEDCNSTIELSFTLSHITIRD